MSAGSGGSDPGPEVDPAQPEPGLDPAPPDPDSWARIGDEDFAEVVAHARRALADLDDQHVTPDVARLRATPVSRLVRRAGRRRLLAALARGGPLWVGLRERLRRDPDLVARLVAAVAEPEVPAREVRSARADAVSAAELATVRRAADELKEQRDRARAERDEARAQRDGALGRERSLREELDSARQELAELRERLAEHEQELSDAAAAREDAVAREARRGEARQRGLEEDLAVARRELDELRRARTRSAPAARPVQPRPRVPRARPRPSRPEVDRVRPGRPSRLPRGTRLDTREGAEALLTAVGRVLVDGYNVTRTHRDDLDLAGQRDWLVNGLTSLAARTGLEVEVVFDAHVGGTPSARRHGGVHVSYTPSGISADDEIVFAVEATEVDQPLVVVTDDRELRTRLAPARVDVLPTSSLVWLLG